MMKKKHEFGSLLFFGGNEREEEEEEDEDAQYTKHVPIRIFLRQRLTRHNGAVKKYLWLIFWERE